MARQLTSFPVPELDHIRYVCMVDGSRAREQLGFKARHTLKETIRAVYSEAFDFLIANE